MQGSTLHGTYFILFLGYWSSVLPMEVLASYKDIAVGDFYARPLRVATGNRQHTSLGKVALMGAELKAGTCVSVLHGGMRYVNAANITHDLLISVYDVNSRSAIVARPNKPLAGSDISRIVRMASSWKRPNIELRAIGLQNGDAEMCGSVERLANHMKGHFMELDLFGTEIRHISIDLKTGMPYNMLLLNRAYRLGELTCTLNKAEYEKMRSNLVFV